MEVYEYKKMYDFESEYWWYRGLRSFLAAHISGLVGDPARARVLDAGCGTGGNLQLLKQLGFKDLHGVDYSADAVAFCQTRGHSSVVKGDLNQLPYPDNHFDLILCSNVFESEEINESKAFLELKRVLKPGGQLVIVVAAFQFLLSEHDRAVHCIRRYNKPTARRAFADGASNVDLKYLFFSVFPLLATHRLATKFLKSPEPQSDVGRAPSLFGKPLYWLVRFEVWLSRFISFPFGSSLIVKIQKPAGGPS